MNTIKQMLRQPVRTMTGIILITVATAVLCVCVGQDFAATATQESLNQSFLSIALPQNNTSVNDSVVTHNRYTKKIDNWAVKFAADNPSIVESIGSPGFISGYLPKLEVINFTEDYRAVLTEQNKSAPHNCAIIEFTLTEAPVVYDSLTAYLVEDGELIFMENDASVSPQVNKLGQFVLVGTINQVFGLQSGWADPTGYTVRINFSLPSTEMAEFNFQVGERYLLYTTDYVDLDYYLRASITKYDGYEFQDSFDPDDLIPMTEEEKQSNFEMAPTSYVANVAKLRINGNNIIGLQQDEATFFRSISVTVADWAALPYYHFVQDENGEFTLAHPYDQRYIIRGDEKKLISLSEYSELYPCLTVVHLTEAAEDFLKSEAGFLWEKALENMEVNNHAFPVIGIDSMKEVTAFARNMAEITQGRQFTPDELEAGARVCLISEALAKKNGLTIGDVIAPQLYTRDPNLPYQKQLEDTLCQPAACYFYRDTMELNEAQPYTIVGIYQAETEWTDSETDPYGFTPNTIFVPKTSVNIEMEYGNGGFYRNFIVENGRLDDFQAAIIEAGYDGQFYLNDNGYSAVESSMDSYHQNARRALVVGVVVYSVILLVYLLLFPVHQDKTLATMRSLGTPRSRKTGHILISDFVMLLPGVLFGVMLGILLWQRVTGVLTENAEAVLSIELDLPVLLVIAAVAAGIQMFLTFILAVVMSKE